ncbi:hypothetical protein DSM112329_01536 [Paraconexibacter sp. AEG42_29]|uniref:Uncharacterized protein n=1 Tax=Paraconexibacter sp. AEG42_29 TaxID=2997339 RepID=A0AAU7ASS2_9ACTN
MTADHYDPLAQLRDRIRDTQEAAARLAAEAESARAGEDTGPGEARWTSPEDHQRRTTEVHALVALLESLRELIPDELREQFRELLRQVLLLARALIDWWVERMEVTPPTTDGRAGGPVVHDIPIA